MIKPVVACIAITLTALLIPCTSARPANSDADRATYPYTLDTCPISGEKLGGMGDAVVKVYDNREVRFCCEMCVPTFESDKDRYWSEIDARIIDQQLLHYPIDTCIVTAEKLSDLAVNHVYNNRLVRFANNKALATFKTDPDRYLEALDKKIVEKQLPKYPINSCLVTGEALGSMGDADNFIYMNRLIRFCCASCEQAFLDNPAKYMAQLDDAYAAQQRDHYSLDACVVSGERLTKMGKPVEVIAGNRLVKLCCKDCVARFRKSPGKYLAKLPAE